MRLQELIQKSGQFKNQWVDLPGTDISGISLDSRKVNPGDIFIALEGGSVDGHQFIPQAIKAGASAIVGNHPFINITVPYLATENPRKAMAHIAAAFYGFPSRSLSVIGVTGTDGKTTTVNLIYQILLACGIKSGMISTVNAVIGDEEIDTGFHVTTPESPMIQSLLRKMVDAGITHVVLETTSHGLDQYRAEACDFDIGVITNITHEHLDYHGSYDQYFSAKLKLADYLLDTIPKPQGNPLCLIFNQDDISYEKIIRKLGSRQYKSIKKITYGLNSKAMVRAEEILMNPNGLRLNLVSNAGDAYVSSPLIGEYNVHNILAAISAGALGLGFCLEDVVRGIGHLKQVPGRMELIDMGQKFLAIVDFAHTPNALKVALETARKLTTGRVIAVFGSAGLRDRQKRRLMSAVSLSLADISILTAEDPRTESLESILAEMADEAVRNGGREGKKFILVPDRGEAILKGVMIASPGDLVIACGKGHEQSMCFGDIEYPWDDRTAMRAALSILMGKAGPPMPWLPTSKKKAGEA